MKYAILSVLFSAVLIGCGGSETTQDTISSPPPKVAETTAPIELTPIQRGAKIYARCRSCHTLEEGGKHKVGPNLWDIYGSKTATKEGYAYSKAMKAADIIWDDETMDAYLQRPSAFMPGNKMTFIGLKKQVDRDAVQVYLKSKTTP